MPLVEEHRDGPLATLTLGAMPAHPLSLQMIEDMLAALARIAADPDLRVVILSAPGRIFCAGHDLKEIARHRAAPDLGAAYLRDLFDKCAAMMQALVALPQPVIAVVEGIATAGGLQLMASCDIALATPEATFCLPGVQNGGFCTTPSVAVGRVIGRMALMEMALTGDSFDATWARDAGLINRIVPAAEIHTVALELARKIARGNPAALAAGKRMVYRQLEMPLADAYSAATEVMIGHFMDPQRIALERETWARR